jgi:hypothetical protein
MLTYTNCCACKLDLLILLLHHTERAYICAGEVESRHARQQDAHICAGEIKPKSNTQGMAGCLNRICAKACQSELMGDDSLNLKILFCALLKEKSPH